MTGADSGRFAQDLTITLHCEAQQVVDVSTVWHPLPIEPLLLGQAATHIEQCVPVALALCLEAHRGAAVLAAGVVHAGTLALAPEQIARIQREHARETLRHWLVSVSSVLGRGWAREEVVQWGSLNSQEAIIQFCERAVFAMPAAQWLTLSRAACRDWAQAARTPPAYWLAQLLVLPPIGGAQEEDSDVFLPWIMKHSPELLRRGLPKNSPQHADIWRLPEARKESDFACNLLLERLYALAQYCTNTEQIVCGAWREGSIGLGWVRSARGVLVHLAQVEQGFIRAYRILPPTLWNFGAHTLLGRLVGFSQAQALQRAQHLALLLDPCVQYHVRCVERRAADA